MKRRMVAALDKDPSHKCHKWHCRIQVTNDTAERAVALIHEYNRRVTHDEDQLQFCRFW